MDDFVIPDRDKEIVFALWIAPVEIEEVDAHVPVFQRFGVILHKSRILRIGMVLEKIIELQRAFRTEKVEDIRSGCIKE